jgi:hypothetical protein
MMKVVKIDKKICDEFVINKHYTRRASIFWAGYALIEDDMVEGVCVFGQPSPALQKHAFKDRDFRLFELARLVVQSKTKNASSFLVGNALRMLHPRPCAVVSFADSAHGHCGYIYQATNWVYTGSTRSHDNTYIIDGERVHSMSLRDKGITSPMTWAKQNDIQVVKPAPKHRYFFMIGNKKEKKDMLKKLMYPIVSAYPKLAPSRYDDGREIQIGYDFLF